MANRGRAQPPYLFEAEVIPGIESFAIEELQSRFGARLAQVNRLRAGFIRFQFSGQPEKLRALRSIVALYQVHLFAIPRPKAFLGHQHFLRLNKLLAAASRSFARSPQSLGLGAAGARTSVMRRLNRELATSLELEPAADGKGELFVRLLPSSDGNGWEALVRQSLQPLSARDYRVVNMPGSLNATVAFAMTQVDTLREPSTLVNLCSGASTILIEQALLQRRQNLLAIDSSVEALEAGRRNASASGIAHRIQHIRAEAGRTPLRAHSADQLYADLPFGRHVGSHEANTRLYPAILTEADRLARPNATFVVLTHEVKLMRRCLSMSPWAPVRESKINLRGLHPRLFVLRRNSTRI